MLPTDVGPAGTTRGKSVGSIVARPLFRSVTVGLFSALVHGGPSFRSPVGCFRCPFYSSPCQCQCQCQVVACSFFVSFRAGYVGGCARAQVGGCARGCVRVSPTFPDRSVGKEVALTCLESAYIVVQGLVDLESVGSVGIRPCARLCQDTQKVRVCVRTCVHVGTVVHRPTRWVRVRRQATRTDVGPMWAWAAAVRASARVIGR